MFFPPRLFAVGAGVRGGSTLPLTAELFAQVRPFGIAGVEGSVEVNTQGDVAGTLQGDTGLPGVARVGGGIHFDRLGVVGSYLFGAISPLELFTLRGNVGISRQGKSTITFAGMIHPLGLLSQALTLGTSIEISSDNIQPMVNILGTLGGLSFNYRDTTPQPTVTIGIAIGG